jgi:hypothetical protein
MDDLLAPTVSVAISVVEAAALAADLKKIG